MSDERTRYLFVKKKNGNEDPETPKARVQYTCNTKANKNSMVKSNKSKHKVKRDSEITVDQEYDMIVQTLSLIVNTMKVNRNKKRRKYKVYRYCRKKILNLISKLNHESSTINGPQVKKTHSSPVVKTISNAHTNPKRAKSYSESQNRIRFQTDFILNSCCNTCDVPECINPFINPLVQARVYHCQKNKQKETCCCSCNSDALFEVMKSLYVCYKKKNCENCDCIMCGHLAVEELRAGEFQKSGIDVGVTAVTGAMIKEELEKAKAEVLLTSLESKTPERKEKKNKSLAKARQPLPEEKSLSEKKLNPIVRADIGLPPEPHTDEKRKKYAKTLVAGIITPLEGKTLVQKENILKKMGEKDIPLPEGRTPSEKALIDKVKATTPRKASEVLSMKVPSEKLRKAKVQGLELENYFKIINYFPLERKMTEQKEKMLEGLAKLGMPLPEGKTPSENKIIQEIRKGLGLPPEGKSPSKKKRLVKAYAAGIISTLKGKIPTQKEALLQKMADARVSLPEGRTPLEKALIDKVKATTPRKFSIVSSPKVPSRKLRKAKAKGLITPLEGKTTEQKEKILEGLAKLRMPLPEEKNSAEKKYIQEMRKALDLPLEGKSLSEKKRLEKAYAAGIITHLEGKSPTQKEAILKKMADAGVPLPEGRTLLEKALIAKIKKSTLPLKAASPSDKLQKARAEGLLTPLDGKSPAQKQKIVRGLAKAGLPLPEGKSALEKKIIQKVRNELGLPTEPKTAADKQRNEKAHAAGIITPVDGKLPAQKEAIVRKMAQTGVPLPGHSPSEKALVVELKSEKIFASGSVPSEKLRKAKAEGLITQLDSKTPAQKQKILERLAKSGLPLPEGKTPSERKLVQNVRKDMGLPVEANTPSEKQRLAKAYAAGIVTPLEGKIQAQKEDVLRRLAKAGVPLPEGCTPSEKSLINKVQASTPKTKSVGKISSAKLREAKSEGSLTSLEKKSTEQREKILTGLARLGLPLPKGKTPSEKKLIQKVWRDLEYPTEPATPSGKQRLAKAYATGDVAALEGKTKPEKEAILKNLLEAGVSLPEGRTSSKEALIFKLKAAASVSFMRKLPSDKLKKAKAQGFLTPLEEKSPDQKEKKVRGLAKLGLPLPESKTPSEKKKIKKVCNEMGYPSEPRTLSEQKKLVKAYEAGIITPLAGKKPAEKVAILKKMAKAGVLLPEGQSLSEKALIARIKAETPPRIPSEKIRKAKKEGLLSPLQGKSPQKKENILSGLAKAGLPLPEGTTASEKILIKKVRNDKGLPPEPKTPSERLRLIKAHAAGIVTPLDGKTKAQKENALRRMAEAGLILPEGCTPSEKLLVEKVKNATESGILTSPSQRKIEKSSDTSGTKMLSEKLRKARAEGLLTPLDGKTPAQKEKNVKGLAKAGLPIPDGKTASEKKLIKKIKVELGLPPVAKSSSERQRLSKAYAAGIVTPLEGKTVAQKEKILTKMVEDGVPLPEGRTKSEKALFFKLNAGKLPKSSSGAKIPSKKLRKARAEGLLTSIAGKTQAQKEKNLRGLAKSGLPLPDGKTASENKLIQKIIIQLGLPLAGKSSSEKRRLDKANAAGIITALEGKSLAQKEKVLIKMVEAGIPLPKGRTKSEKALIFKLNVQPPSILSENLRKAKATGLLTPLDGKTTPQKEKILKPSIDTRLPLPEGNTQSEKKIINRIKAEAGVPAMGDTLSEQELIRKAKADGLFTPLTGKTKEKKVKIIKGLLDAGLPEPEGKTSSEKALINTIIAEAGESACFCTSSEPTLSKKLGKIKKNKLEGTNEAERELKIAESKNKEIDKTTKCDQSCGCENKKIRFKHSYIKIRVTSPHMETLCPCPVECIPGIKSGVIIDSEGIKVTVGTAIGVPTFRTFSRISRNLRNDASEGSINVNKSLSNCTDNYLDIKNNTRASYFTPSHSTALVYAKSEYIVNNMEQEIINLKSQLSEACLEALSNYSMSDFVESSSSAESILVINSDSSITFSKYSSGDVCASSFISCIALASGKCGNMSPKSNYKNHVNDNDDILQEVFANEIDYSSIQAATRSVR